MRSHYFLFVTLVCASGIPGAAQEFYGGGVTARTSAHAGIYLPSSDNALDALALNPAGLTALSSATVNLSATAMFAQGQFSNAANSNSPMQQTRGVIPFGAFGIPLGHSRWSVGAAFIPDLLSKSNWNYNDAPGASGVTYGKQQERSEILAFRTTAGAGFSISPKLSIGASVGAVYNQNTLDAPYIFQSQPVLKGLKTLLDLHTTGVGWTSTWGLRAKIARHIELGAAYRTRTSITSTGTATGNLNALFAALGVAADPKFAYRARVNVVLPQSALLSINWQANARTIFSAQGDWTDWYHGFRELPVSLTNGTNPVVNSLLHSTSLYDAVPLNWKQQFAFRAGVQRMLGESFSASGGYVHRSNPVPSSTLTPLTAAVMQNGLSTGIGYSFGRSRVDLSYGVNLMAHSRVNNSALLAGEYSHSAVNVSTQGLTLSASFHP